MDRHGVADIGVSPGACPAWRCPWTARASAAGASICADWRATASASGGQRALPGGFGWSPSSRSPGAICRSRRRAARGLRGPASHAVWQQSPGWRGGPHHAAHRDFLWDGRPGTWAARWVTAAATTARSPLALRPSTPAAAGAASSAWRDATPTDERPASSGMARRSATRAATACWPDWNTTAPRAALDREQLDHGEGAQRTDVRSRGLRAGALARSAPSPATTPGGAIASASPASGPRRCTESTPSTAAVPAGRGRHQCAAQDRHGGRADATRPCATPLRFLPAQRLAVAQARGRAGAVRHWQIGLDLAQHGYASHLRDGRSEPRHGQQHQRGAGRSVPRCAISRRRARAKAACSGRTRCAWAQAGRWSPACAGGVPPATRAADLAGDNPAARPAHATLARWTLKLELHASPARRTRDVVPAGRARFRSPPSPAMNIGLYLTSLNYVVKAQPGPQAGDQPRSRGGLRWSSRRCRRASPCTTTATAI